MSIKQYAERDAMELDEAGGYYCRHVSAMTAEQLHRKGDIAAELGHRDMIIDQLTARAEAAEAELKRRDAQEPVAEIVTWWPLGIDGGEQRMFKPLGETPPAGTKLYAAAPAVVLPPEMTPKQSSRSYGGEVRGFRDGYNQCRADTLALGCQPEKVVKRKIFTEFQICHYGASEDYAKGYIDAQSNFTKDLEAAGVKWEGSK